MEPPPIDWASFLAGVEVIDLAQPAFEGMPSSPSHPDYRLHPIRRHGDVIRDDGGSAANEMLVLGGHLGTHIDALGHVSHMGLAYGGTDARRLSTHRGLAGLDVMQLGLIVRPALVLDLPAALECERLEGGQAIGADDIERALDRQRVTIIENDVVLIRTGWGELWSDSIAYSGQDSGAPGIDLAGAKLLTTSGVSAIGGDTLAVEVRYAGEFRSPLPVHTHCLVEVGVPLIENLNLEPLAARSDQRFLFVALPLPLEGASGSPIRPVALLDA